MLNSTGHESCHFNIYEQDDLPAQLFDFTPVQHFNINYGQDKGHVLLRRVFSLIQKSDQNYWILDCIYW